MSKYDFEVDLAEGSSTGIILNKIQPGSVVLEFGCATGRMTRYMKEALDCQVYIVEYEKDAFDVAMQYAADGVCEDLLKLTWLEKFAGITFDAILFADVLEHLADPDLAVSSAAKLLKKDGCIYTTIPNVTHNDIVLKAIHEHFDYTKVGLLDDTHIHFWGYENLAPFVERNGLQVKCIQATYRGTGSTEQYEEQEFAGSQILLNLLKERSCGEVYQFVVTMERNDISGDAVEAGTEIGIRPPFLCSHIYYDTGTGFQADNVTGFKSEYCAPGTYHAHYEISDTSKLTEVRFDPLEGQSCIVRNLSISQKGELQPVYSDHIKLDNGVLLTGTDPFVIIAMDSGKESVVIDADIILAGQEYLDILQENYGLKQSEIVRLSGENIRFTEENVRLTDENIRLGKESTRLSGENTRLEAEIARLNGEIGRLQADIGAYIVLVNKKDELLIKKEQSFFRRIAKKLLRR